MDCPTHYGRYADESDVARKALRVLERQEFDDPPLEAAILEGVVSPHTPYLTEGYIFAVHEIILRIAERPDLDYRRLKPHLAEG